MKRRNIDPWGGWDQYASVPAIEVINPTHILTCSGMCAPNEHGRSVLPPEDVTGQISAALDQVDTLLHASGYVLADVIRMNIYTLNVDAVMASYEIIAKRLKAAGASVAGSLVGVTKLGLPDLVIEIQVTAMK
jgi:enamine deaminase RidA (YjgF/YER057c/UK114 family)